MELMIDGLKVMEELLRYKGTGIIENKTVRLELLAEKALEIYNLAASPGNRLYVYKELVHFFKQEYLFSGNVVIVPESILKQLPYTSSKK